MDAEFVADENCKVGRGGGGGVLLGSEKSGYISLQGVGGWVGGGRVHSLQVVRAGGIGGINSCRRVIGAVSY